MNTKKNPGNVVFSFASAAAIVAPSVAWAKVNIRRPALISLPMALILNPKRLAPEAE